MELLSQAEDIEVEVNPHDRSLTPQELAAGVANAEGVITQLVDKMDRTTISGASSLKVISQYAVGFNNIDVAAARERKIVVTNTPNCLHEATADLAWALILGITRRVVEGDVLVRAGGWKGWSPEFMLGMSLQGKVLGIIGMGQIGLCVARRARAFGMSVIYHNRHTNPAAEREVEAVKVDLPALLARSDIVSLHCPLTPETRGMLAAPQFHMMKRSAYLVNTARGPCVVERDLIAALKEGAIAGAALDVYDNEPVVNPEFFPLKNVVVAPHLGSATGETRVAMGRIAIANALAVLRGQAPPNPVPGS